MNLLYESSGTFNIQFFDTGKEPSALAPERFYHGFVLGLLVEMKAEYVVKFNRESGFGRYDIVIVLAPM